MNHENQKIIEGLFPQLLISGYDITSPSTREYNCIAWAAGNDEAWWWPDPDGYWPAGIPKDEDLATFIRAYETLGYVVCKNAGYEDGFEKIAIYVDSDGTPTHAARQLGNGRWTSKLGKLEDIEHGTLEGLHGQTYGTVAVFMKRKKS